MKYYILILLLIACCVFNSMTGIDIINDRSVCSLPATDEEFIPMSDEEFLIWKQEASPLETGLMILNHSEQQVLSEVMTKEASGLLSHDDLFVKAAAEWALSLRIGNENKNDIAVWPKANNPEWFIKWYNIPPEERIEMDWCRQAIAAGICNNPEKMIAQIAEYSKRIHLQLQNDYFHSHDTDMVRNVCIKIEELHVSASSAIRSGDNKGTVREYWLKSRRILRPLVFASRDIDFDSLIFYTRFAPHHKPNVCGVLHNGTYKPGGDITILEGLEKVNSVRTVIGDKLPAGHIHGMDLHFDGDKVVFGYGKQPVWPPPREAHHNNISSWATELRQTLEPVSLYEINIDGTGLQQLTSHPVWSDTEPVYCPNDDIAFSSERSAHSVVCDYEYNDVSDVNLYLLKRKDNNIRRLTNHRDIDMTPRLLNNGLLGYLRWEYQERNFNEVHSIWTVHPDGTYSDALYKQHIPRPYALREVRSVPNSNKLVAIAAGHHCYARGPIIVVDPEKGGNNPAGMEIMTPGIGPQEASVHESTEPVRFGGVIESRGYYRNPYPLSETVMLASYGYASPWCNPYKNELPDYKSQVESNGFGVYLIDSYGNKELIYRDPIYCCVDVGPLKKRNRPVVIPDLVNEERNYATCVVTNIYDGADEEVEDGSIKYIRVSQHLPSPYDKNGRALKFAFGHKFWGSLPAVTRWTSVREIGLVPVEDDGSAHFKVPVADKASVYFQALDENYMEVVRMRSSVSFQPGEMRSCTGCHETQTYRSPVQSQVLALNKPAVMPQKPARGYEPFDYETMVQPIFDNKCIGCHAGGNNTTYPDLTDKKIPVKKSPEKFNQSYISILGPDLLGKDEGSLVALNDRMSDGSITKPKQFGSHNSKFIKILLDGHQGVNLTDDEWYTLVTWVDYNAPYHGRLVNRYPADGSFARRESYKWPDPWRKYESIPAFTKKSNMPEFKADTTLIIADKENGKIFRFDLSGNIKWEYDADSCSDIHLLPNENIVIADGSYVKEIDRSGRAILKYDNHREITSCQPLPNGFMLVADSHEDRLIILDRRMKPLRELPLDILNKGQNCIRKIRIGPKGTYFVAQGADKIVGEYDKDGRLLRRIPFGEEVYCVIPQNNGDLIMGGKGGIKIAGKSGHIKRTLQSDDIPGVNSLAVIDMVCLPDGNIVVVNKTGNPSQSNGLKVFEINKDNEIVHIYKGAFNLKSPASLALTGYSTIN